MLERRRRRRKRQSDSDSDSDSDSSGIGPERKTKQEASEEAASEEEGETSEEAEEKASASSKSESSESNLLTTRLVEWREKKKNAELEWKIASKTQKELTKQLVETKTKMKTSSVAKQRASKVVRILDFCRVQAKFNESFSNSQKFAHDLLVMLIPLPPLISIVLSYLPTQLSRDYVYYNRVDCCATSASPGECNCKTCTPFFLFNFFFQGICRIKSDFIFRMVNCFIIQSNLSRSNRLKYLNLRALKVNSSFFSKLFSS